MTVICRNFPWAKQTPLLNVPVILFPHFEQQASYFQFVSYTFFLLSSLSPSCYLQFLYFYHSTTLYLPSTATSHLMFGESWGSRRWCRNIAMSWMNQNSILTSSPALSADMWNKTLVLLEYNIMWHVDFTTEMW